LNLILCPDTYLGVGQVIDVDGQIRFSGGNGRIIDYCVKMKRLPEALMLDRLVANHTVDERMIERIAERLSEFHRTAIRGPDISKWGSQREICHNWEENFTQTEAYIGRTISAPDYEAIHTWVNQELVEKKSLFELRVRGGHVVDGHGDVRCESICVTDDVIRIYDCIEFNDRFRCDDVASEVAFLAMDLDARGRPDLGYYFTEVYQGRTGDGELFGLLPFYRCYRAYVRGKVLSFRLNEVEFNEAEKATAAMRAGNYFELARRYADRLKNPTLIVICGLSGTGKTSVARAIAGELGLRVVSADAVRQSLFGALKGPSGYAEGAYTDEANQKTYRALIETGREILQYDRGVILDATFRRKEDRELALEMAAENGAQWRMIECSLPPELTRTRLDDRTERKGGLSDATWQTYLRQREEFESPDNEKDHNLLRLDTSGSFSATGRLATDWLRRQE
jgi:aminoglycoside phosphotransferase family enzyme/predicted kinase